MIHPTPILGEVRMLSGLSTFWFERTAEIIPNHLLTVTQGVPAGYRRPRPRRPKHIIRFG